jgi:hypothetical protein
MLTYGERDILKACRFSDVIVILPFLLQTISCNVICDLQESNDKQRSMSRSDVLDPRETETLHLSPQEYLRGVQQFH